MYHGEATYLVVYKKHVFSTPNHYSHLLHLLPSCACHYILPTMTSLDLKVFNNFFVGFNSCFQHIDLSSFSTLIFLLSPHWPSLTLEALQSWTSISSMLSVKTQQSQSLLCVNWPIHSWSSDLYQPY